MNHFVFLSFYFGAKNGWPALGMANSLVVRRVSPGRIIVVFFLTKYAVPRQIKPGIHKLTTSRGQRNLCTVFIFVSREEKGFYRIVSLGHQNFDCRSYCGLSRRMQGGIQTSNVLKWNSCKLKCKIIDCFHEIIFISMRTKKLMRKKSKQNEQLCRVSDISRGRGAANFK